MKADLMKCPEILKLFGEKPFDAERARKLLREIDDINKPIWVDAGYSSTLLYEAQTINNIDAVSLLFELGADPNLYIPAATFDCALWNLQYEPESDSETETRFSIAKLFFRQGANPNLICEDESLFNYVGYKVYNEMGERDWRYICRFFMLLLAYGGGSDTEYYWPSNYKGINREAIDQYRLRFVLLDDGYHVEALLEGPGYDS